MSVQTLLTLYYPLAFDRNQDHKFVFDGTYDRKGILLYQPCLLTNMISDYNM